MPSVIAVLIAALLFGTTGTSQALGPDGATPFAVGVVRLALGGTVLALLAFVLAARHHRRPNAARADAARADAARADAAREHSARGPSARPKFGAEPALLMAIAGIAFAVYQPLFFVGAERNGVAVGTVIALGSSPILAGLMEWALTRRRPHLTWLGATLLATAGVTLLGVGGGAAGGTDALGIAASVGAGASFAVIANTQRRLLAAGWDPFTVVGSMGAISAFLSVFAIPFVDLTWLGEPRGILMALWLGIATVAAAYTLFTWGLSGLTASTAATLTLGEPLTASILGVTVLGERLSLLAIVGLIVLAAGLVLLAWRSRRTRDPGPFPIEA